jgi:hypothetical protein
MSGKTIVFSVLNKGYIRSIKSRQWEENQDMRGRERGEGRVQRAVYVNRGRAILSLSRKYSVTIRITPQGYPAEHSPPWQRNGSRLQSRSFRVDDAFLPDKMADRCGDREEEKKRGYPRGSRRAAPLSRGIAAGTGRTGRGWKMGVNAR